MWCKIKMKMNDDVFLVTWECMSLCKFCWICVVGVIYLLEFDKFNNFVVTVLILMRMI